MRTQYSLHINIKVHLSHFIHNNYLYNTLLNVDTLTKNARKFPHIENKKAAHEIGH